MAVSPNQQAKFLDLLNAKLAMRHFLHIVRQSLDYPGLVCNSLVHRIATFRRERFQEPLRNDPSKETLLISLQIVLIIIIFWLLNRRLLDLNSNLKNWRLSLCAMSFNNRFTAGALWNRRISKHRLLPNHQISSGKMMNNGMSFFLIYGCSRGAIQLDGRFADDAMPSCRMDTALPNFRTNYGCGHTWGAILLDSRFADDAMPSHRVLKRRLLGSGAHLNGRLSWYTMSLDKILVDIAVPDFRTNYECGRL